MDNYPIIQTYSGYFSNIMYMSDTQPIKNRLQKEMKERRVNVAQLSEETGINVDRMYKWFGAQNSKISHDDALIIEKWLAKQVDNNLTTDNNPDKQAPKEPLEQAILNLTMADLTNARNIERLIALLELKWSDRRLELPEKGTPGTRNLAEEKEKQKSV